MRYTMLMNRNSVSTPRLIPLDLRYSVKEVKNHPRRRHRLLYWELLGQVDH